ncbi:MAG: LytTR family transcriptional regulator, partial [Lachnospiraceae bacterium]|nr:LytTR family transcriptional regulator [Lachnospiraceae bacterium]
MEKVIYIESNLHKLIFHIFEGELVQYTMYETLNKISEMVSEDFLRIHQSYLVNLKFIRRL